MSKIKLYILFLFISILFISCAKKEKYDNMVAKEYLEVNAICSEKQRDEKILFQGYLAHIYNQTQKRGFRHGTVTFKKMIAKITPIRTPYHFAFEHPSG
jgi:hypothetical protein